MCLKMKKINIKNKIIFKEFKELRRFMTQLARDTEDTVIDDLADQIINIFNKYRTHIRKKYPKSYKRVNEEDVDDEGPQKDAAADLHDGTG